MMSRLLDERLNLPLGPDHCNIDQRSKFIRVTVIVEPKWLLSLSSLFWKGFYVFKASIIALLLESSKVYK